MTKNLKLTLIALFLLQILISSGFELAHDEAYYWLYSRHLDWGYFDHPPFVAIVIRFFSFLPQSEFAVRIGFIILQFASLFLLLSLTGFQFVSLLLFFSFPLASVTGLLALPDIPLLFMTASYCYFLKKYLEKDSARLAVLLGLNIALLFYAKYHGVLLVFFTIIAVPKVLKRKSFYLVTLIAVLAFMPHLFWQHQHEYSTLRYHFIDRPSSSFSLKRTLEYIGLQIFLAGFLIGPVVWWIILKKKVTSDFDRAMKFISIGTVLFFLFSSFAKKVEANWTIFLAIPMIYLISGSMELKKLWNKRLLYCSFIIIVLVRVLFVLPESIVNIKRINEFKGWKVWSKEIQRDCEGKPLLANSYQIASKLSYYLNTEIGALNYHSRKNQFDFWRFEQNLPTKEICYVTDKRDFEGKQITSPDGKSLRVVKNQSIEALLKLKYKTKR